MIDRLAAIAEIRRVFSRYKKAQPGDKNLLGALKDGKLYELYVLSCLVEDLTRRGFSLAFSGTTLKFKASPGRLKVTDPHFDVIAPGSSVADLWIFVDIEFETLGSRQVPASDNSCRHELDIVVVATRTGYPSYDEIALGIECKAVANFEKGLIKEVLGVRRELSFFRNARPSRLTMAGGYRVDVPADPPSEFWLAFLDAKGLNYRQSPAAFGVDLRHIEP
jgi:hypothetical protein